MKKSTLLVAFVLALWCHICNAVPICQAATPESVAATQPSSRPETLSDMLKGVRVVGTSVIFDNASFNALLKKRIPDPNGWPEIVRALAATNADILYSGLRRQPIPQQQAFYEWALTKADIKHTPTLEMLADGLDKATGRSTADGVFAIADVKEPSLLAVTLAGAFTESKTKDVERLAELWGPAVLKMGDDRSDPELNMLVGQYVNLLMQLKTPAADVLSCKLINKYMNREFMEIPAAIESLGKRKVAGAFETIRNVADAAREDGIRVTAVEALASIAATPAERSEVLGVLSKVRKAVEASEDREEELKRRLEVVESGLRKHAESRPKDG